MWKVIVIAVEFCVGPDARLIVYQKGIIVVIIVYMVGGFSKTTDRSRVSSFNWTFIPSNG
jgi:hypothetical protein